MAEKHSIGIIHYKVGGTDGVSLEIDKWKHTLEEMGHEVHLCAGDLGTLEGTLIPEMYHHLPEIDRLYANTFVALNDFDPAGYKEELDRWTDVIERKLRGFILDKKITFLIPQNVWCVAANPAVAIAVTKIMEEFNIPALAHNHDFYWERTDGVALTCAAAVELADKYLPPHSPLAKHVVINSLGQAALMQRKGIASVVVPNIFDFDAPPWVEDEYNQDFRRRIGVGENDILILQATRIVRRKGIELALDVMKALDSPKRRAVIQEHGLYDGRSFGENDRIIFLFAGYSYDDPTGRYVGKLRQKIDRLGVDALFIEELVEGRRQTTKEGKIYSLWDTYVFADFVSYPSLWEGWGNQLLEALRARLPVMLFEYPVYQADLKDKGLQVVSLGGEVTGYDDQGLAQVAPEVIESAADQAVELLTNPVLYEQTVEHNFQVGKQHYSMPALKRYLEKLVGS